MAVHFIGLDVHCSFTEMAVVNSAGGLTRRQRCSTTIPALLAALAAIRRPRHLTFEEGPMAGWLYRNLQDSVDELVVCDARRNHLVAKDSDKDDPIDAEKLAQLLRGGYLKSVHQSGSLDRAIFKQHVGLYHDCVRDRVRIANMTLAQFRRFGVFASTPDLVDVEQRPALLERLPHKRLLRADVRLLCEAFDAQLQREDQMRRALIVYARQEAMIGRFMQVPGIGWVRAATFFVYIDTPWRFGSKQRLWKYAGLGLERTHSGAGPTHVHVAQYANRRLRGALLGAAKTAVRMGDNAFFNQYQHWTQEEGIAPRNAARNVARSLAATLWGMWKNESDYRPQESLRGGKTADTRAALS
jgi:transposase